jgi:multidrug transporter EmrE-like cation transporter
LAGSVSRLSLLVPVLFALAFLGEQLTATTALGILGAFGAFALLSPARTPSDGQSGLDHRALWYFPVLVLVFGFVDLWANLFNTLAPAHERSLFVVLIFTAAIPIAWVVVVLRRVVVRRRALLRGLVLGLPNYLSTYFLLECLRAPAFQGRSAVVYAIYSAAGVALTFAAGPLIWRERLEPRHRAGVVVALAAVILLNLRG